MTHIKDPSSYTWVNIEQEIIGLGPASPIKVIEVVGKRLCVAWWNGNVFAFAFKCPHAGGILADGYLDMEGNIVCPIHRYKYSLENGYNTSGEGYYLSIYPVDRREGGLYIGLEKKGFWGFL